MAIVGVDATLFGTDATLFGTDATLFGIDLKETGLAGARSSAVCVYHIKTMQKQ